MAAKEFHPNVQITIKELNKNGHFAFLDLNVNVDSRKQLKQGC